MKRSLMIVFALSVLMGCSKSPLDRVKNYKPDPNKPAMSQADEQYWKDAARKNSADFKEALDYCNSGAGEADICYQIEDIHANVKYGDE